MFDIGFTELLLIGIVALIVIGPERLPAVARQAGQWVSKVQRFVRGVKTDLASELESGDLKKLIGDQREQINELKTMVSSAKQDFESSTREVVQGAKKRLNDMETSVQESAADVQGVAEADATTAGDASSVNNDKATASNADTSTQPASDLRLDSADATNAQLSDASTSAKSTPNDSSTDTDRPG